MVKLGDVGVVNCHGRYLQAIVGEIHASKPERGDAETWILWQIDWARQTYALQNRQTRLFLGKPDVKCVTADRDEVGRPEQWVLLSGDRHGVPGRIAFRAHDGTIMGSNPPKVLSGCGGEIMAADRVDPSVGAQNSRWAGWFYLKTQVKVVPVENGLAEARW